MEAKSADFAAEAGTTRALLSSEPTAARERPITFLLHERAFGAFFLACWLGVVWVRGLTDPVALEGVAILAAYVGVVVLLSRSDTLPAWWVRLTLFVVVMCVAYSFSGPVVHAMGTPARDRFLEHVDTVLFGMPLPLRLQPLVRPWLTDLLSVCYSFHYPYVMGSCLLALPRTRAELRQATRFFAGLFTVFAVGFLGYITVPAAGPYLADPGLFHTPLGGGFLSRANTWLVQLGSNAVDVFPSLHTGASGFILAYQFRHARRLFYVCALPVSGLVFATLYLRYHYGIDVVFGLLLIGLGLLISERRGGRIQSV